MQINVFSPVKVNYIQTFLIFNWSLKQMNTNKYFFGFNLVFWLFRSLYSQLQCSPKCWHLWICLSQLSFKFDPYWNHAASVMLHNDRVILHDWNLMKVY